MKIQLRSAAQAVVIATLSMFAPPTGDPFTAGMETQIILLFTASSVSTGTITSVTSPFVLASYSF